MKALTKNALTFVAGYCDTATFIAMGGIFSAHITGNFVLFAASLAKGVEPHDFLKILTFPFFVIAVIIGTVLYHKCCSGDSAQRHKRLLQAMTLLLIIAAGTSFIAYPGMEAAATMTVVVALGIQNTIHHFLPGPMTTVMAGTVMNTTASLTERYLLKRTPEQQGKEVPSLMPSHAMIASFLIGCVLAALITTQFGLMSLVLPALFMFSATIMEEMS